METSGNRIVIQDREFVKRLPWKGEVPPAFCRRQTGDDRMSGSGKTPNLLETFECTLRQAQGDMFDLLRGSADYIPNSRAVFRQSTFSASDGE